MPTVVLKLFAGQGTDGQSGAYMLPPLGGITRPYYSIYIMGRIIITMFTYKYSTCGVASVYKTDVHVAWLKCIIFYFRQRVIDSELLAYVPVSLESYSSALVND